MTAPGSKVPSPSADHRRGYGMGVLLGLSLAELMLLLVFAMLLTMGFLQQQHEDQARLTDALVPHAGDFKRLKQAYQALQPTGEVDSPPQQPFDDWFTTLVASYEARAQQATTTPPLVDPKKQLQALTKALGIEVLKDLPIDPTTEAQILAHAVGALEGIGFSKHVARADGALSAGSGGKGVTDEAAIQQATAWVRDLNATNTALREQLKRLGKGTEKPSCWYEPSGKVEYIFDVALTDDGYVIHDRALPHRAHDQALLPLSAIRYDTLLSPEDFRTATQALHDYMVKAECRFFVVAFDQTGTDKERYKLRTRALEEHFYRFESRERYPHAY